MQDEIAGLKGALAVALRHREECKEEVAKLRTELAEVKEEALHAREEYKEEAAKLRLKLADAEEDAHYAHGVGMLALKHRDIAEGNVNTVRKALVELLKFMDKESLKCDTTGPTPH